MATTYIPPDMSGQEFLDSMLKLNGLVNSFMENKRREELLKQEMQEGKLRQAGLRLQNEELKQKSQEWQDTKDVRIEGIKAHTAGELAQTELLQKQVKQFDVTSLREKDKFDMARAEFESNMKNLDLDRETKQKRLAGELPETKAQIDQLHQATLESMQRIKESEFTIKHLAGQEAWGNFGNAMKMLEGRTPAEQQIIRENIATVAPDLAPYVNAFKGTNLSNPKTAAEDAVNNIIAKASAGDEKMYEAGSLLSALRETGGRGVPTRILTSEIKDPKTGKPLSQTYTEGYDVQGLANTIRKAFTAQNKKPDVPVGANVTPGANNQPPQAGGNTGPTLGSPGNLNNLPLGIREKWKYLQSNPSIANQAFYPNRDKFGGGDKGMSDFLLNIPRERGEIQPSATMLGLRGGATIFNDEQKSQPEGLFISANDMVQSGEPGKAGKTYIGAPGPGQLTDPIDRSIFEQNYDPDKDNASVQQRVMYDALMRELAKARNIKNDKAATSILKNFLSFDPTLLTDRQFGSIKRLTFQYNWNPATGSQGE